MTSGQLFDLVTHVNFDLVTHVNCSYQYESEEGGAKAVAER